MDKVCGTCKWHSHEDISGDWVCINNNSDYCADWTDYDYSCEYYEEWE